MAGPVGLRRRPTVRAPYAGLRPRRGAQTKGAPDPDVVATFFIIPFRPHILAKIKAVFVNLKNFQVVPNEIYHTIVQYTAYV